MLDSKHNFSSNSEFLAHLDYVESGTEWCKVDVHNLNFAVDETANPFVTLGGSEYGCLMTSFDGGITYLPWGSTTMGSVLNRCEISGRGIERLFLANKREFCDLLNTTIQLVDKGQRQMLALVRGGKLHALHSGRYAPISERELFDIAEEYLSDFEYHILKEAEWTPELVYASYLIEDEELLNSYEKIMGSASNKITLRDAEFSLRVATSDIAESSATVTPQLITEGIRLPLLGGRGVAHKGEITRERLEAMLYRSFTAFEASFHSLAALADIKIRHKKNAMIKAFTAIKFPQKYCVELCERYDNVPASALEVYKSMAEALDNVRGKGNGSMQKTLIYEEMFCKLLLYTANQWATFDVPGVVAWGAKARNV